MKRFMGLVGAAVVAVMSGGCSECAGTPSCRGAPEISIAGQFVEHKSGSAVGGVVVRFVRLSGSELTSDTVSTVSDGEGNFQLRGVARQAGEIVGVLHVIPHAPDAPYVIPDVVLHTSTVRGAGVNLGRLVVNPYLLLIGHVRDRKSLAPLPGVTVVMRRTGGGRAEQDSARFTTDFGGQFSWQPAVLDPAPIEVEFEIQAPGYPRAYRIQRVLPLKYRDSDMTFVVLPAGSGFSYTGQAVRRGSGENVAGTTVEFARISGVPIQPATGIMPLDFFGRFAVAVEPLSDGEVVGEIRVLPPPRFPPETTRVRLRTSDDDTVEFLGFFRYGAQIYLDATLRDALSGEPIEPNTDVTLVRTGGIPLDWPAGAPNRDRRRVSVGGRLEYHAPTAGPGTVGVDLIVEFPVGYLPDTIRNLQIPAHYSDSASSRVVLQVRRRPAP